MARFLAALPLLVAAQAPWPLPRADAQRSGRSPFAGPLAKPPLAWRLDTTQGSPPILLGPLGPISTSEDTILLFDFFGGPPVQCAPFAPSGFSVYAAGLGPSGRVYVRATSDTGGDIYALDTSPSGCALAWASPPGAFGVGVDALGDVQVFDSAIIAASGPSTLLAFSPLGGDLLWTSPVPSCVPYSGTLVSDAMYLWGLCDAVGLVRFGLADGEFTRFSLPAQACVGPSTSAVLDGATSTFIYGAYGAEGFCVGAFSLATGAPKYQWGFNDSVSAGPGDCSALVLVGSSFLAFLRTSPRWLQQIAEKVHEHVDCFVHAFAHIFCYYFLSCVSALRTLLRSQTSFSFLFFSIFPIFPHSFFSSFFS